MKTGDKVYVEVSRNRERLGEIASYTAGGSAAWVRFSKDTLPKWFSLDKIKQPAKDNVVAIKDDAEKPMMSLIPHEAIEEIANAFTFGAKKYSSHNWRNGFKWSRLVDSAMRHLQSWNGGQDKDPESGLTHLAHLGACIAMLIAHEKSNLGEDDRWKK